MIVNAITDKIKVYSVQDRLDAVIGVDVQLEIVGDVPPGLTVSADNDPVLALDSDGKKFSVMSLGFSQILFIVKTIGDDGKPKFDVIKYIDIYGVDATHPIATTLNGSLGAPVQK